MTVWKVFAVLCLLLMMILTVAMTDTMVNCYRSDNRDSHRIVNGVPYYGPRNQIAIWEGTINVAALWAGGILLGVVLKPRAAGTPKE